ncbi:MBL fold metallo-hydrolase [Kribbella solani]|uniref:Glyoxylase-like metal-dependent hydrolase (Beta-lactamase superfamily II) n=1 Tax=Kribbella solani TaxID=236067 RepID=A0A841DXD5_9ACTN|nr:MBL fold metallo-hydrolase [Kribbella solani]MBB5981436.1 glyoxylase-like metal-dependent hydrolase (beta-lactamase superfamily II) [Kribbella solani]MDX2973178.1 MBL fold metallo-hydrolase [Kribbella solani]MDX3005725.1 MBL fold metallo-hydrolase [Kribbella solani]
MNVTDYATLVLAANPGPMTLDGTNTWILRAPGAERSVVVDPGPMLEDHLRAVLAEAGQVAVVLLTHNHPDHSDGAAWFANQAGCGVRAVDPAFRIPTDHAHGLSEGDVITVDGLRVEVLPTPGHTLDSVCFWLPQDGSLLTGDTVLGRGTSVVAYPDGALGPYLNSLEHLRAFANSPAGVARLLPGHGPVIDDPSAVLTYYLNHRQERLTQVREALAAGHTTPEAIVAHVYADVDKTLWPAAERSVRAQLEHLNS